MKDEESLPHSDFLTPFKILILHCSFFIYPTLPSKEMLSSFCASTANSIGSLLSTSLA